MRIEMDSNTTITIVVCALIVAVTVMFASIMFS